MVQYSSIVVAAEDPHMRLHYTLSIRVRLAPPPPPTHPPPPATSVLPAVRCQVAMRFYSSFAFQFFLQLNT